MSQTNGNKPPASIEALLLNHERLLLHLHQVASEAVSIEVPEFTENDPAARAYSRLLDRARKLAHAKST